MKGQLIYFMLSRFRTMDQRIKRNVLIGAGLVSVLLVAVLVGGSILAFKAGSHLVSQAKAIGSHLVVADAGGLGAFGVGINQKVLGDCGGTLVGLLAVDPWIKVPLAQTFHQIKTSCWGSNLSQPPIDSLSR